MKLQTQGYLSRTTSEPLDPRIGLPDLRKGLHTMLLGYFVSIGAVLAAAAIVGFFIVQSNGGASRKLMEEASTVLFALVILLPLAGIASLTLIVRGKWLCLLSAPERFHAKWMMFLSILCILAGPLLNAGVFLVGDDQPKSKNRRGNSASLLRLQKELEEYKEGMPELDTRSYVKLAGQGIGLLSGVFFVLFLRAVALCWGTPVLARFTEVYLLFIVVLVTCVVVLLRNPALLRTRPQMLLGLAAGWLLAGLWYFGLLWGTSISVRNGMERHRRERLQTPAAPVASLPPL